MNQRDQGLFRSPNSFEDDGEPNAATHMNGMVKRFNSGMPILFLDLDNISQPGRFVYSPVPVGTGVVQGHPKL